MMLLSRPHQVRLEFVNVARAAKAALGQYMTPAPVARFMASLLGPAAAALHGRGDGDAGSLRVLDPGAGHGALAEAVLARWQRGELGRAALALTAHELDDQLHPALENALAPFACQGAQVGIVGGDFLAAAAAAIRRDERRYTHAILNPPYQKISTASAARLSCRSVGLETVNLYAAFVGLALGLLAPGGQLVAIVPRSFCNGPYYRPFRDFLRARAALRHLHLFERRDAAFRDDDVLQENVIVLLERDGVQGPVALTSSADASFSHLRSRQVPFDEVVRPGDAEGFWHIPGASEPALDAAAGVDYRLDDLGIAVSTGPVVDFRLREHLLARPEPGAAPLLYPAHVAGPTARWPILGGKKANALARNASTERWLMPAGSYAVVRRFSAKEERRRVVASVVDSDALVPGQPIAFENHLNVFHRDRAGLPPTVARGLCTYLNSSAVDAQLRRFNGHTQVNATDLRALPYPGLETLLALGRWAEAAGAVSQRELDLVLRRLLGAAPTRRAPSNV